METAKKSSKKVIFGVIGVVILVAVMALVYVKFSAKPVEGSKNITITVIDSAQEETVYELKTDAEFLRQAMEEADGLEFGADEGPYGLSVHTVNGERADYNLDGAYWGFNVNGTYCNYGVDSQPVMDGDAFEIVYTLAE